MEPEQTERRMKMTKQRQRKVTQDTLRILTLWWQEHIIIGWLYSTLARNISSEKNISPTLFPNCTFGFVLVFAYSCLLCLYFSFASLTSSLPCSGKLLRIRLLALMLLSPRGFGDIFSSPFGLFQILMPYSLSDLFNYWTCNVWSYLRFVIFLHGQNFWRVKFTPKNTNFSR